MGVLEDFVLKFHIPDNIISEIISNITDKENRLKVMRICKNWLNLARLVFYNGKSIYYASRIGDVETVKYLLSFSFTKVYFKSEFLGPFGVASEPLNVIDIACERGHKDVVKELLKDKRVDPSINSNYSLSEAVYNNFQDIVKELLKDPRVNPTDKNNSSLDIACELGHIEIVEILLEDERINDIYSSFLIACEHGRTDVVRAMLNDERLNPSYYDNMAIQHACCIDNVEVVRLLLESGKVDPKVDNNKPLRNALKYGHLDIVKEILNYGIFDWGGKLFE